jgi:hypothetical protein
MLQRGDQAVGQRHRDAREIINQTANSAQAELQKGTSVLNTEEEDESRSDRDQALNEYAIAGSRMIIDYTGCTCDMLRGAATTEH